MILGRSFYSRKSTVVSRDLIGKKLIVRKSHSGSLSGIIVETEAYGGLKDPASHAFRGETKRNKAMFGEAGFTYVYFTYGFHHCLNLVCGRIGDAQAVLLRAIEPVDGLETMRERRGRSISDLELTNGPGKLCQALGIDLSLNEVDATKKTSPIYVLEGVQDSSKRTIASSVRIGISVAQERRWRFFDSRSPYVSHRSKLNLPTR
jgi:DNA-3-methyladenine glycosylase